MQRKRIKCKLIFKRIRSVQVNLQNHQKTPESVVKDALKEKTEHVLSPKQVSGDKGVDYKVLQKRGSYDGTTLVRLQQIYEGKEVYGHQLTAHVDKKGIIKSVSGKAHKI